MSMKFHGETSEKCHAALAARHFDQKKKLCVCKGLENAAGGERTGESKNFSQFAKGHSPNKIPAAAAKRMKQMGCSFFSGVYRLSTKITAARAMAGQ